MKKVITLLALVFLAATAFVSDIGRIYMPVFMKRETLNRSVSYVSERREMKQTGKIYYRAPYIYVNERYKGVHVINNTDPAHPINEGFIIAPGCIDLAIKGNILYIDNAVDLVSFDLDQKIMTQRIMNVFPEPLPPEDFHYFPNQEYSTGLIIVEWKKY